jgi:hypothetical protein
VKNGERIGIIMSNVRNIYFSDEAFTVLEKIELFDSNDKKLSRSNIINKLILDKLKVIRTREEQELIFVKKDIVSILKLLKGMEFVQSNESYCERIEKSIKILRTIHASLESEVEIMKNAKKVATQR